MLDRDGYIRVGRVRGVSLRKVTTNEFDGFAFCFCIFVLSPLLLLQFCVLEIFSCGSSDIGCSADNVQVSRWARRCIVDLPFVFMTNTEDLLVWPNSLYVYASSSGRGWSLKIYPPSFSAFLNSRGRGRGREEGEVRCATFVVGSVQLSRILFIF